jgi:hypothetical protein
MEYVARQAGRLQDTVFLIVCPVVLYWQNVKFTLDVSNKNGVSLLTLEEAIPQFDIEVMCGWTNWYDPNIQNRLQIARKYEVLVPYPIPPALITGI